MRLNSKTAKELRGACGYRNQTATPSKPVFPGVARFYTMPVYMTRPAIKTSYELKEGRYVRVLRRVTSMHVVGHTGREPIIPVLMVEQAYPATVKGEDGIERPHPQAGQKFFDPKLEMVPVTKPISATGPKKTYRLLKRLHRQGLMGPDMVGRLEQLAAQAEKSPLFQQGGAA